MKYILFILLWMNAAACRKFITVDPPATQIIGANVYNSDETATSAVRGIYLSMLTGNFFSGMSQSITMIAGLSSDELQNNGQNIDYIQFFTNSIARNNGMVFRAWEDAYKYIWYVNNILEGLAVSSGVSASRKSQLEGEALLVRAFCHFYLVNIFGDVPVVTTTDYTINNVALRKPVSEVYELIVSDLLDAESKLAGDYAASANDRTRPNKFVAKALLARVYLYLGKWELAAEKASDVIDEPVFRLEPLSGVFLAGSTEAIWQLYVPEGATFEGEYFILQSTPNYTSLTEQTMTAFEPEDDRRMAWIGHFSNHLGAWDYAHKYKNRRSEIVGPNEHYMILRLAEQYLIRAEARANLEDLPGARADLDSIRHRAGLPGVVAPDKNAVLAAVEQERRVELFAEWGHRWLDLKRWGKAGLVLKPIKGSGWQDTDVLYPIPAIEITNNTNLTQNDGYK